MGNDAMPYFVLCKAEEHVEVEQVSVVLLSCHNLHHTLNFLSTPSYSKFRSNIRDFSRWRECRESISMIRNLP